MYFSPAATETPTYARNIKVPKASPGLFAQSTMLVSSPESNMEDCCNPDADSDSGNDGEDDILDNESETVLLDTTNACVTLSRMAME